MGSFSFLLLILAPSSLQECTLEYLHQGLLPDEQRAAAAFFAKGDEKLALVAEALDILEQDAHRLETILGRQHQCY